MIISVHIPKTAGKSFLAVLRDEFGEGRICEDWHAGPRIEGGVSVLGAWVEDFNKQRRRIYNYQRRRRFDCIHGHFTASTYAFLDGPMVAWVRDPVERVVSHHAFFKRFEDQSNRLMLAVRDGMPLLDFAAQPRMRDLQSRYLDVPLDRFAFIGRTEHFDEDLPRAAAALGFDTRGVPRDNTNPDKKGDRYELEPGVRARLEELNRADRELHAEIVTRFHS
jgi:hypothetical protein